MTSKNWVRLTGLELEPIFQDTRIDILVCNIKLRDDQRPGRPVDLYFFLTTIGKPTVTSTLSCCSFTKWIQCFSCGFEAKTFDKILPTSANLTAGKMHSNASTNLAVAIIQKLPHKQPIDQMKSNSELQLARVDKKVNNPRVNKNINRKLV